MIVINKNHLSLFKKLKREYLYYVQNGIFLAFDSDTLEYIGIEMFYLAPEKIINVCDEKVKQLLSLDILEIKEGDKDE